MPVSLLPALLLQILVVGYTPGPANIYSLTMAIRYGRARSMRMWLGLLTGATTAVLAMALITHLLGEALGSYVIYLKYLGAAYLVWLA
jgi:cysteine/O-acetylserine efflux protein